MKAVSINNGMLQFCSIRCREEFLDGNFADSDWKNQLDEHETEPPVTCDNCCCRLWPDGMKSWVIKKDETVRVKHQKLLERVLDQKELAVKRRRYGPYILEVPQSMYAVFQEVYWSTTDGACQTVKQRVLAIDGVDDIVLGNRFRLLQR